MQVWGYELDQAKSDADACQTKNGHSADVVKGAEGETREGGNAFATRSSRQWTSMGEIRQGTILA